MEKRGRPVGSLLEKKIVSALRQRGKPMTAKSLCAFINEPPEIIQIRLCQMRKKGKINKANVGYYAK